MQPKSVLSRVLTGGALAVLALAAGCSPEQQAAFSVHIDNQNAVLASVRSQSGLSDD